MKTLTYPQNKILNTNTSGLVDYPEPLEDRCEDYSLKLFRLVPSAIKKPNFSRLGVCIFSSAQPGSAVTTSIGVESIYPEILHQFLAINVVNKKKHPLSAHLGSWMGGDIKEVLDIVHNTRSKI